MGMISATEPRLPRPDEKYCILTGFPGLPGRSSRRYIGLVSVCSRTGRRREPDGSDLVPIIGSAVFAAG